ncbi:hypothetical protein [Pseudomonas monsensis]
MSHQSSSGAEKVLGMLFTATCVVGIFLYRLYKEYAEARSQEQESQQ